MRARAAASLLALALSAGLLLAPPAAAEMRLAVGGYQPARLLDNQRDIFGELGREGTGQPFFTPPGIYRPDRLGSADRLTGATAGGSLSVVPVPGATLEWRDGTRSAALTLGAGPLVRGYGPTANQLAGRQVTLGSTLQSGGFRFALAYTSASGSMLRQDGVTTTLSYGEGQWRIDSALSVAQNRYGLTSGEPTYIGGLGASYAVAPGVAFRGQVEYGLRSQEAGEPRGRSVTGLLGISINF